MGRYVNGDWSWKFALGDQSSSFGQVLEEITDLTEDCHTCRYVGTNGEGEKVELYVENWDQMANAIAEYVGIDFKVLDDNANNQANQGYWDKLMMRKFLKEKYDKEGRAQTYYFDVEY